MNQHELATYVEQHLPTELRLMHTGGYATACPELTAAEKAVIYHYTANGSTAINRQLHASGAKFTTMLAQALRAAVQYRSCPPIGVVLTVPPTRLRSNYSACKQLLLPGPPRSRVVGIDFATPFPTIELLEL